MLKYTNSVTSLFYNLYRQDWLRQEKSLVIGLALLVLLIGYFPTIYYGYSYPSVGTDSAVHMAMVESGSHYVGESFTGVYYATVPLHYIHEITGISASNIALWLTPLSVLITLAGSFVFARYFFGKTAGYLASIFVLTTPSFYVLYRFGVIPNLINLLAISLISLIFLYKYVNTDKLWYLVPFFVLVALSGLYHSPTFPHLIAATTATILLYSTRSLIARNYRKLFGLSSVLLLFIVIGYFPARLVSKSSDIFSGYDILGPNLDISLNSMLDFMMVFVGVPIVMILILTMQASIVLKNRIISSRCNFGLTWLLSYCIISLISIICHFSTPIVTERLGNNLSIMISLLVACVSGYIIYNWDKKRVYTCMIIPLIILGLVLYSPKFFRNNASLDSGDRQAVRTIKTIDSDIVYCTSTVELQILASQVQKELTHDPRSSDYVVWKRTHMVGKNIVNNIKPESPGLILYEDQDWLIYRRIN